MHAATDVRATAPAAEVAAASAVLCQRGFAAERECRGTDQRESRFKSGSILHNITQS
jgi:hypothetical protein